jgi:hypothetical protein
MAKNARLVVLLAVLAVLAGCTGPGLDKAGGSQPRQPVVLTLANFNGDSGELEGSRARCGGSPAGRCGSTSNIAGGSGRSSSRTG